MNLTEGQDAAVKMAMAARAEPYQLVRLSGAAGCHAAGARILLANGQNIVAEAVRVGMALLGPDGRPRLVRETKRGFGPMRRVIPTKGTPFVVNDEHLLTLTFSGGAGKIEDVAVRDWEHEREALRRYWKLYRVGVESFPTAPTIELPLDPYFLGVLLGDGTMQATVGVCKQDPEIMEMLSAETAHHGLALRKAGTGTSATWFLTSGRAGGSGRNPIVNALRALGLMGTDCRTKAVPLGYKYGPRAVRLAILAGLLDTDGSKSSANSYDYISASWQLAEDVTFLARSCGLAAYNKTVQKRAQTGVEGTYYRVSISGETQQVPLRIQRKKAEPRGQCKDVLRTGFTTECVEDDFYYGFTLDGDGRYLLADFTVTHNTGKTTVLKTIIEQLGGPGTVTLIAPTGKAALRAKEATGLDAMTIHRWLYRPHLNNFGESMGWTRRPVMTDDPGCIGRPSSGLVICDEASMVAKDVFDDIWDVIGQLGCSLLLVGDGFQLPPVDPENRDTPFSVFAPDFESLHPLTAQTNLTEVMRQALDSYVLRCATEVRKCGSFKAAIRVMQKELRWAADPISSIMADRFTNKVPFAGIVHRNVTRMMLNLYARGRLGRAADEIEPGEPLLIRKNNYDYNFFNGEIALFEGWADPTEIKVDQWGFYGRRASVSGRDCYLLQSEIWGAKAERAPRPQWAPRDSWSVLRANLGYALTCHSSQGSEWDGVLVVVENSLRALPDEERIRWLYTAVTRAKLDCMAAFLET